MHAIKSASHRITGSNVTRDQLLAAFWQGLITTETFDSAMAGVESSRSAAAFACEMARTEGK